MPVTSVRLTPEVEQKLATVAERARRTKSWLINEAVKDYLDRLEREAILNALEKTRFNRTAAAKMLGITFRSMRYRMERLGIE